MTLFLIAAAVAAVTVTVTTPALAADVGISVSIGQPGFYGRLDIGDYPQPQVIYVSRESSSEGYRRIVRQSICV